MNSRRFSQILSFVKLTDLQTSHITLSSNSKASPSSFLTMACTFSQHRISSSSITLSNWSWVIGRNPARQKFVSVPETPPFLDAKFTNSRKFSYPLKRVHHSECLTKQRRHLLNRKRNIFRLECRHSTGNARRHGNARLSLFWCTYSWVYVRQWEKTISNTIFSRESARLSKHKHDTTTVDKIQLMSTGDPRKLVAIGKS